MIHHPLKQGHLGREVVQQGALADRGARGDGIQGEALRPHFSDDLKGLFNEFGAGRVGGAAAASGVHLRYIPAGR